MFHSIGEEVVEEIFNRVLTNKLQVSEKIIVYSSNLDKQHVN